jgi:Transposase Tn5 dimerisation domain
LPGPAPLNDEHSQGFHLHPLLAVTPGRLCLGTLWLKLWAREELGVKETRRQRPIEQKESCRWLEGYREACAVARQCPQTQIICVQDSEADIYELLALAQAQARPEAGARAEHLVRACQDRRTDGPVRKLWAKVEASPVLGGLSFEVPRRGEQPARKVRASVRARPVRLRPPRRTTGGRLPGVKVWAVLVRELYAPANVQPVEWLLLSSLPVGNLEEALQVVEWYGGRWEIEIFFKVLKLGCQIERLQLETAQRLRPAFALYLIVAWRILYVTMLGRAAPELSCAAVFETAEWKAVWMVEKRSAPPAQAPSLGEMIQLIARLGGYKARKGDGQPGPQVMWEGLRRVFDLALAWEAFGPEGAHTYV